MKSKKRFFLILLSLIFTSTIFAQDNESELSINEQDETDLSLSVNSDEIIINKSDDSFVNWFTPGKPLMILDGRVKVNNYHSFSLYTLSTAVTIKMDMKELLSEIGFDFSLNQTNCTIQTIYAPTFFDVLNAGVILINHFQWYYYNYYDFDFLTGLYLNYKPVSWFEVNFTGLYQLKCTRIFDLANTSCPEFRNNCPAFSLKLNFYPLNWLSTSISLSSYDFYRYYLFFAPIVKVNVGFKCNDNLILNLAGEAQFVDFFTLSANFNSLSAIISATWRF